MVGNEEIDRAEERLRLYPLAGGPMIMERDRGGRQISHQAVLGCPPHHDDHYSLTLPAGSTILSLLLFRFPHFIAVDNFLTISTSPILSLSHPLLLISLKLRLKC